MKTQDLRSAFAAALEATGVDLKTSAQEVAAYAADRGAHLAAIAAEPGIAEACEAEADRVWLYGAQRAVRAADAADGRAIALIRGVLLGLAGGA